MSEDDVLVTISTRLTAGQIKRLKELEKIDQMTMARHIRGAVEEYLRVTDAMYSPANKELAEKILDRMSAQGKNTSEKRQKTPIISYR